jgi:hypothetical protein
MADAQDEDERVERLVADSEREARSLEKDAEELGDRIDERRGDWMRKRRDEDVPGAPPPKDDEAESGR